MYTFNLAAVPPSLSFPPTFTTAASMGVAVMDLSAADLVRTFQNFATLDLIFYIALSIT